MIIDNLKLILGKLPKSVTLVAVSKTKPNAAIMEAYDAGHRVFGENKVQDMLAKYEELPSDIQWHMIGHLQTNKVKFIAPFVSLIHGVDSLKLILNYLKSFVFKKIKIYVYSVHKLYMVNPLLNLGSI